MICAGIRGPVKSRNPLKPQLGVASIESLSAETELYGGLGETLLDCSSPPTILGESLLLALPKPFPAALLCLSFPGSQPGALDTTTPQPLVLSAFCSQNCSQEILASPAGSTTLQTAGLD